MPLPRFDQRDGCCERCFCRPKHADEDNTGDDVDGRAQDQQVRLRRSVIVRTDNCDWLIREMSIAAPTVGSDASPWSGERNGSVRSDQPGTFSLPAHRQCRESGSIVDCELLIDVVQMDLDRTIGNIQPVPDLLVRKSF